MPHASISDPSESSPSLTASKERDVYRALGHLDLTEQVQQTEERPRGWGSFSRVYYGKYTSKEKVFNVAIKRMYVKFPDDVDDEGRIAKMIAKELEIWSSLSNPNVHPLLGFIVDGDNLPALISEWMGNGTIFNYIKTNPQADLLRLVNGIASGLAYLHDAQIVHADLKSDNIYMSSDGNPLLADFGISRTLVGTQAANDVKELMGSIRWMATELLNPDRYSLNDDDLGDRLVDEDAPLQTKKTDIWAFGMVVYELLTGRIPFAHLSEVQVLFCISGGRIPRIPKNMETLPAPRPSLWTLYQNCCETNPDLRPEMTKVVKDLRVQALIYQDYNTQHNIITRNASSDFSATKRDAMPLLQRTDNDMTEHLLRNDAHIGPLVPKVTEHFTEIRSGKQEDPLSFPGESKRDNLQGVTPDDFDPQFLIPRCGVFIPTTTYFKYSEAYDDDSLDCDWKREYSTLMAARIHVYPYLQRISAPDRLGGLPTAQTYFSTTGLNIPNAEIDPCAVQDGCNITQRHLMMEKLTGHFVGTVNLLGLLIYVSGHIVLQGLSRVVHCM